MISTDQLLGGGLGVALVTPFDERGRVDEDALARLVSHVVEGGADFLVALGSTAEASTLTDVERTRVLELVAAHRGPSRLVVGVSSPAVDCAIGRARTVPKVGADGVLLSAPAYVRPTQAGIVRYFEEVTSSVPDLSVIAYNVPSRTAVEISVPSALEILSLPNVLALKESSGDIAQISRIAAALPPGRALLAGDDALTLPTIAVGGRGVVSVAGNVVPEDMRRLVSAALNGDAESALNAHRALGGLFEALCREPNPIPIKAALARLGIASARPRLPLLEASDATRDALALALAANRKALQHA